MVFHIECVLDLGTSKWVAAYAIYKDEERIPPETPLMIADRAHEVPVIATWVGDDFKEGFELEAMANKDRKLSNKIISHHKLGFYEGPETEEHRKKIQAILDDIPGNRTLDDLTTEHIRAIMKHIREALLKCGEKTHYGEPVFKRMIREMRVRITVPQIWSPKARRRIQTAAKNAGLKFVVLAYEQQCALSFQVNKWSQKRERLDKPLKKGDSILVADLGCGTGDFAAYELDEDLDTKSKLVTIEHSTGDICGSLQVDILLYEMLKKQEGAEWRVDTADYLGVTERDFDRRALQAIERVKKEFAGNEDKYSMKSRNFTSFDNHLYRKLFSELPEHPLTFLPFDYRYKSFQLDARQIHSALDQVIAKVTKRLDRHIDTRKPRVIEITGGFAKNSHLMMKLRNKYEPAGIDVVRPNITDISDCYPVAVGGLLRYDSIRAPVLPSQFGYALLERQPFDPNLHRDSYEDGDWEEDEIITKQWVRNDPFHPETEVVDDRLRIIVQKGQKLLPGQVVRKKVSQVYTIPMAKPRITAELVYLTAKLKDYMAARKLEEKEDANNDDECKFRAGVHHWASVDLPIELKDIRNKGFQVVKDDGEKFWEVRALVWIKNGPQDMEIAFDVLKPKQDEEWDSDKEDSDDDEFDGEVAFTVRETIWDSKHSERHSSCFDGDLVSSSTNHCTTHGLLGVLIFFTLHMYKTVSQRHEPRTLERRKVRHNERRHPKTVSNPDPAILSKVRRNINSHLPIITKIHHTEPQNTTRPTSWRSADEIFDKLKAELNRQILEEKERISELQKRLARLDVDAMNDRREIQILGEEREERVERSESIAAAAKAVVRASWREFGARMDELTEVVENDRGSRCGSQDENVIQVLAESVDFYRVSLHASAF
ncbi:uncharacterized protein MYCFIDRAFT_171507 [Pseudocercospora fijiensis CIRAD86]|uniref:Uncharacterized protein n=1 Tax=Pseudocercospora fijiensis (strain CIRAD86) TaxID=383855 RepID=M3A3E1_PSEFD|nr:uncharacterized protein MYCFIDRAFT_171507 [Pseudocercospora fijiensis CIRAD86]EME85609.1 hypothetical protein MYCFIDRAFT_171507 [Pseudocercospora fijiensis CIRAD86]